MSRRAVWGEARLFAIESEPSVERFRMRTDDGPFGPVLASLVVAAAQARAAVLDGRRVEIASIDGTVAAVERAGGRFVVTPRGPASWASRCERLLVEHG